MEKWCLLGASRGLGKAFAIKAAQKYKSELFLHLSARTRSGLENVRGEVESFSSSCEISTCDFTKDDACSKFLTELQQWRPNRIFYFAGGGPYGFYEKKEWKDHLWSLRLNLLFPAQLLHSSMNWEGVQQWVLVGSDVAESKPDPMASSYASGKHGLKGLVTSLQLESKRDIRLYSPGYMDTDLLPPGALVRTTQRVESAEVVAQDLLKTV